MAKDFDKLTKIIEQAKLNRSTSAVVNHEDARRTQMRNDYSNSRSN